ncbi:MAG: type IV pilus secretin PilQ [Burkholderiales bacterium]|nr:MAG: type IV pilus secretin PilQ [Burkholderiales bacterium]
MKSLIQTMRIASSRCVVGALLLMSSGLVLAQNSIDNLAASVQGGAEVIRIDFAQALTAVPAGFSIQTPARIALDFPGLNNNSGKNLIEINQGNLRSANIVQAGERTRVVLNLKQSASYKTEIQGKSLLITLDAVASSAPVAASAAVTTNESTSFAQARARDIQALKDIDFRRSQDGAGRVVVDLPSNQVGVDIKQQGQTLVVEFLKTNLPEGLRRRLDVADFGTPVQIVTTTQTGDRVRMVVEPKGAWDHSAYQSDNQFVLEVRPQKIDPTKLTQGPGYSGEKLSLNFQNIEVRSLLQVIADFTNFNVVTSDTVSGAVTLRLKDVPWDQALDIILQAKGLGMRKNGNVLWIAPKDELAAKEKQDLEAKAALQTLEPVRSQAIQLNYTKAAEIAGQLGASTGSGANSTRLLSARGSVIAEPRTNQLFVTDIPSKLEEVQALIAKLDVPIRQVMIEARIVEASDQFGKSLGVKLGGGNIGTGAGLGGGARLNWGPSYIGGAKLTRPNGTPFVTGNATFNGDGDFFNMPASGQNGFNAASLGLLLFNSSGSRLLNLELSALEGDGKGRIVSSPRVITADQTKALIEQGTELPYQVATSSGATSIAFRKANLKLEVTPQITPEGNIILDVDVNKDSVGQATAAGFAINTKHVKTQVLIENGGTVVIGGIFELIETSTETRVPFVSDIPVVGNIFKNRSRTANKQELLVFLTPRMITDRAAAR